MEYYPTGQIAMLDRRSNGRRIERYDYAPNGRLYQYQNNWNDDFGNYLNSYTYFVYPVEDVPFDPTGHIMEVRSGDKRTAYVAGQISEYDGYGYLIYYGDNNGYNHYPSGWEPA